MCRPGAGSIQFPALISAVPEPTISSLIGAADRGDRAAREDLFAALYDELRRLARRELGRPGIDVSLGATTLLHEAYLDIAGREGASFPDRARFIGYAARVMRGLIIDHARERRAAKRGGGFVLTSLTTDVLDKSSDPDQLADIGRALDELATFDGQLAEVVDLKFFCGFSFGEIAQMRGLSERTVQRNWEKARLYLHEWLRPGHSI